MMGKRLTALAVAAVLAFAMAITGTARAENTKLTVMVFLGMQNLPIFAAQSQGFFAKHGLSVDMKITPGSEVMRKGLADGQWQIIHTAIDNGVAMADVAKVDVVSVIGGDNSFNHLVVQPEIKSIKDLRNKTVIVDALNTAYAFQLYDILKKNGLYKGEYSVKSVGATYKRLAEMKQEKTAAAAILNPPFSILAAKAGLKDLGPVMQVIGPYQGTVGITLRSWAREHPDILVKYLQAYIEGLRWSLDPKNKDTATNLLMAGLKLDPATAAACYALVIDPVNGLAKDGKFDIEGFRNVLKLRAEFEGGAASPPEKYIDLSYYQKALGGL
ncbi:MAG: ABC transporter substrate-binding protein [Pseudolabrys sp.]|jgi:ABC-type nitrate/sulfonate/bicarbonate transport system substrate-binding protein